MNFQSERRALPRAYMPTVYNNQLERARKTRRLLTSIQLAENYVFCVENLFFSRSHANWLKNGSKRRIWSKMRVFHKNWLTAKGQFHFPTRKTGETDRKKMKRSISKLKLL